MLGKPEFLAHQAAEAIACHGIAGGFYRHGQPDTRMSESIRFHAQREEAIVDASSAGIDRVELQLAAKAQLWTKT